MCSCAYCLPAPAPEAAPILSSLSATARNGCEQSGWQSPIPESILLSVQLPAGFEICEEGDIADCFYILHDGEVNAYSFTASKMDTQLKAPALLGQVALLQEQDATYVQRQCGYRCKFLLQARADGAPCAIVSRHCA